MSSSGVEVLGNVCRRLIKTDFTSLIPVCVCKKKKKKVGEENPKTLNFG